MAFSIYISDDQLTSLFDRLDITFTDTNEEQDLIDRAVGEFEGDMVERYVVPLMPVSSGDFSTAPQYTQNLVLSTIKAKIRHLLGTDKMRNVVVDSSERYIDLHKDEYDRNIKRLLDPKKNFGLALSEGAEDSVVPIQKVGVARACDRLKPILDTEDIVF